MIQDLGRPLVIQDCPKRLCLVTLVDLLLSAAPVVGPAAHSNQNCISPWGPCGGFGGPKQPHRLIFTVMILGGESA